MEVTSAPSTQVAWKQVAALKQKRLETGGAGETLKQITNQMQFISYTKDGRLQVQKSVNVNVRI